MNFDESLLCLEKELVIASKSYVVDSKTYSPENLSPVWWVVSKGEGSIDHCLGIGFNFYKPSENEIGEFDLIKWGKLENVKGEMTAFYSFEDQTKYLNVIISLDEEDMWLSKSYLYVGTLKGLEDYYAYEYYGKPCYKFYNWFFTMDEPSNIHHFKIAVGDIVQK